MFLATVSADECGKIWVLKNYMQMGSDPISSANALRSCSAAMTRAVTIGSQDSQFTQLEQH